jgi:hypothetical protein
MGRVLCSGVFRSRNCRRYLVEASYENLYKSALLFVFMNDSRAAHRHRVLKAGAIEFSGGGGDQLCRQKPVGKRSGSRSVSALDIPDRLILCIPAEHFKRHCHVVWRNEKRIGVAFE